MTEVPHLEWPFRLAPDGGLAVVEQGDITDLQQCVDVLRHTERGDRVLAPHIGVEDPTFVGVDPVVLAADLMEWEPRATVRVESAVSDDGVVQAVTIRVTHKED